MSKKQYRHLISIQGSMFVYSDKEYPDYGELVELYYDSPLEHDDFNVMGLLETDEIDEDYNEIREVELKENK